MVENKNIDVKVYSLKVCPNCKILKDLLIASDVIFTEIDMATPAIMTDLSMRGIFASTAPLLEIESQIYYEISDKGRLNIEMVRGILSKHGLIKK